MGFQLADAGQVDCGDEVLSVDEALGLVELEGYAEEFLVEKYNVQIAVGHAHKRHLMRIKLLLLVNYAHFVKTI